MRPMNHPPKNGEESIFQMASGLPAAERGAYLDDACGDDATLRARIDRLLGSHEASAFMKNSPLVSEFETEINHDFAEHVGERIGRYKLLQRIGEGGFGSVWMAEQTEPLTRKVALKIIKLGMDTREVIARFEQERQALAMMDHPNIAMVLDAGATEKGRPFFVMELVKGMPITQYCDEAGLGTRERLALFGDVCSAISHAHQKGIIHRDIKPSNVMVTLYADKPVVKVIDFGIAKATQGRLTDKTLFTRFEQFVGTPVYMSPEQASLSSVDIDTRSDIYGLGVLLYELLVGKPPFDGKSLLSVGYEEMRRIIREVEPEKPSSRLGTIAGEERTQLAKTRQIDPARITALVEPDLDWIVMKAIDKDRTRRYETANAFLHDIQRFLADEPVSATPPSAGYQFRMFARRNRRALQVASLIGGVLAVTSVMSTWAWLDARRARIAEREQRIAFQTEAHRANEAERDAVRLRQESERQELDARRRAYAADMLLCQRALKANNLREARQLLDRQRPAEGQEDLRGWEWRWLWNACRSGALYEFGEQESRVYRAIHVDGGRSIVTYEDQGAVRRINLDSRRTETLQEPARTFTRSLRSNSGLMTVSQDRRWIAAVGQKDKVYLVRIWDLLKNSPPREMAVGEANVTAIAISPDGSTLATYSSDLNSAFIWDINDSQDLKPRKFALDLTRKILNVFGAVRFSPDGRSLAVGGVGGEIRLIRTAKRIEDWTVQGTITIDRNENLAIAALDFSPDGRLIACGRMFSDPRVFIADVGTLQTVRILSGHTGFVPGVAFSPDGKMLASASADQTLKMWDVETWKERGAHLGHTDEVWSVDFSPDGERLITSGKDQRIEVWPTMNFTDRDGSPIAAGPAAHFSPGGRKVLFVANGVVTLVGDATQVPRELGTDIIKAYWTAPDQIIALSGAPYEIRTWNLATGQIETFPLEFISTGPVKSEYLPNSHLLVFTLPSEDGENAAVVRWDIATRRQLSSHSLPIAKAITQMSACFSLDGRRMAVPQYDSVAIYDILNGTLATNLAVPSKSGIQGMALSPDGKQLAVAERDRPAIMVRDVDAGRLLATLIGHNLVITRLEYSPDGTRLLSSAIGSEPVKVWSTVSWKEVARLEPPSGAYYAGPTFTPDGSNIATGTYRFGSGWSEARLFHAASWDEISAVETKAKAETPRR
jgi:eukaryotic-like serine/threonine-protein kinase